MIAYLKGLGERVLSIPLLLLIALVALVMWIFVGAERTGKFVDYIREKL